MHHPSRRDFVSREIPPTYPTASSGPFPKDRVLTTAMTAMAAILITSLVGIGSSAGVEPMSPVPAQDVNSIPVVQSGSANVELHTAWNSSKATLDPGTATAPEGWTIEYSEDGSTWSTTEPADTTSVEAVRARGIVPSQGDGGDDNTLRLNGLTANVTGSPLEFAASSGGDGYDVAFPDEDRVINVYHHNGPGGTLPVTFNCKLRSTGEECPEGQIIFDDDPVNPGPGPYIAPNNSRVTVHQPSRKAYTPVVRRSDWALGFLCVDYSLATPAPCDEEFIQVSTLSVIENRPDTAGAYLDMGGTAFDDQHFFIVNGFNHRLYCLDMATASICDGFEERGPLESRIDGFELPVLSQEGPGGPGSGAFGYASDISVIEGRVYFFHGNRPNNSTFGCVDPEIVSYCQGTTAPAFVSGDPFDFPPFPLLGTDGTLEAVCLFFHRVCIHPLTSALQPMPTDLAAFLDPTSVDGITAYTGYAVYFSLAEWGLQSSRLFFPVEAGGTNIGPMWPSDLACWDFATSEPCDFGANGDEAGIMRDVTPGLNLYAFVADPYVDCIWSNSDSGFVIAMGTDGGQCGGDDSLSAFAFDEDDARLDCDASSDPIRWTELNLTLPDGLNVSSLRLTVRNGDGEPVTGWEDIAIANTTIDLSELDIDATGPAPTFDITLDNTGIDVAAEVTAELQYVTPPPELCLDLTPITSCTLGQAVNGLLPAPPVDVTHSNSITIGATTTTDTETTPVGGATYDAETLCGLGALEGTTTRATDGSPVPGATVTLRDPVSGAVLATTTTDSVGAYRFDNLTPGTYTLEFSDVDGLTVTPATATTSPIIVVDETAQANGLYEDPSTDLPRIPSDYLQRVEQRLLPETM